MNKIDTRKKKLDFKKLLIEESESDQIDIKSSNNKKPKLKKPPKICDLKHFSSSTKISKVIKDDQITLTEHSNILKEYETELKFLGIKRKPNDLPNSDKKIESNTTSNSSINNNLILSDNKKNMFL